MAKKKSKKTAARSARKTRSSTRKAPARKSKSKPAARKKPAASPGGNSVDKLLKTFAKDRAAKEAALSATQKKKQELEEKVRSMQQQVSALGIKEREQSAELVNIDRKRDDEVQQLLERLGIKLGGGHPSQTHDDKKSHVANDRLKQTLEIPAPSNPNGRNDSA